jgi:hypothetical protein
MNLKIRVPEITEIFKETRERPERPLNVNGHI